MYPLLPESPLTVDLACRIVPIRDRKRQGAIDQRGWPVRFAPHVSRPSIGGFARKPFFSTGGVHRIGETGSAALVERLHWKQMRPFFSELPPYLIGVLGSHARGPSATRSGSSPSYVKACVKRDKSDALEAEAICQAVQRPTIRFVPVKTVEQQSILMTHHTRSLLVCQRTMVENACGHIWQNLVSLQIPILPISRHWCIRFCLPRVTCHDMLALLRRSLSDRSGHLATRYPCWTSNFGLGA